MILGPDAKQKRSRDDKCHPKRSFHSFFPDNFLLSTLAQFLPSQSDSSLVPRKSSSQHFLLWPRWELWQISPWLQTYTWLDGNQTSFSIKTNILGQHQKISKEEGLRVTQVRSYFASTCSRQDVQRLNLIPNDWLILKRYKSGPSSLNTSLPLTGLNKRNETKSYFFYFFTILSGK